MLFKIRYSIGGKVIHKPSGTREATLMHFCRHPNMMRLLDSFTSHSTSVVVMDEDFVKANPGADKKFMQAMAKAYGQYKADTAKANQAFKTASNLDFSLAALDLAASVEPNLSADNAVSVVLSDKDKANIQKAADFMLEAKILKKTVDTSTMIRSSAD